MTDVIIRAESLAKKYRILHQQDRPGYYTLRDALADKLRAPRHWLRSRLGGSGGQSAADSPANGFWKKEDFWALKDVSFDIEEGEVIGIIGRNGAGKSTLLKILSRITEPTEGRVRIRGRVASLLEVGTGFHPELTGRENVYLNGSILGMTKAEIKRKFDEIVAFAEIEQFLDTPVKRYSSGMYVRLAFAVAAHLEPEILIVDEVLAVGDVGFQRKCMDYMKKLSQSGITILMVSHNLFAVKAICRRVLVLSGGRRQFDGLPAVGIDLYEKDSQLEADPWAERLIGDGIDNWPIVIRIVEFLDEGGSPRTVYDYGERMRVRIHYEVRRPVKYPNFYLGIRRSDNVACCSFSAARDGVTAPLLEQSGMIELLTPPLRLVSDLYGTYAVIWDQEFKKLYCGQIGPNFHVRDDVLNSEFGVFHEPAEWRWRATP
ncbi:MAG: ABC transporter ATP-binding protein [Blastocatellia bacterium]|nr:ABC transporter ATP-binding protein [Blastocatellia bacterium]